MTVFFVLICSCFCSFWSRFFREGDFLAIPLNGGMGADITSGNQGDLGALPKMTLIYLDHP